MLTILRICIVSFHPSHTSVRFCDGSWFTGEKISTLRVGVSYSRRRYS